MTSTKFAQNIFNRIYLPFSARRCCRPPDTSTWIWVSSNPHSLKFVVNSKYSFFLKKLITSKVIDMGLIEQYESGKTAYANATHFPVMKDTVVIPSGGFVRIRFRACNPGFWFMHCHFEFHMSVHLSYTVLKYIYRFIY